MTNENTNTDTDIDKDLAWAHKLSSDIFKEGSLINVTISLWEGKTTQSKKDQEVLDSKIDNEIYTPGFKWLAPQKHISLFYTFRARLSAMLDKYSYKIPGMRGSRFVPKNAYPTIKRFLTSEKEKFNESVVEFVKNYPEMKAEQINNFNQKYPNYVGYLDSLYPSEDLIQGKFNYSWTLYSWAQVEIAEIASDAKNDLSEKAAQLVYQSGLQIRNHIIEATEHVVKSIQNSKNTIDIRIVKGFAEKLDRLKQINLFNDPEIEKIINGAQKCITSVSSWKREDVDSIDIEAQLCRVVNTIKQDVLDIQEKPERLIAIRRAMEITNEDNDESEMDLPVISSRRQIVLTEDE